MTTPDSHIPNSNAYPSGGNRGVQSYVPAPQGVPQAGVPAQPRCHTLSSGSPPCVQPTSPIISILEILLGRRRRLPAMMKGTRYVEWTATCRSATGCGYVASARLSAGFPGASAQSLGPRT